MEKMRSYRHKFRFRKERTEYDFQIKKSFPWWVLLLLLLLGALAYFRSCAPSLPVIKRCSDVEANNGNGKRGDHSIGEHSLGQPGTFVFKFYTNTAPDVIRVYDGSILDVKTGKAPLIFIFGDDDVATDTVDYSDPRFHRKLESKAGVVTVVVDNGTDWGYIVNCPEDNTNNQ